MDSLIRLQFAAGCRLFLPASPVEQCVCEIVVFVRSFTSFQGFLLFSCHLSRALTEVIGTVEPLNSGNVGDKSFVHCSEVVPPSDVETYGQYIGRG